MTAPLRLTCARGVCLVWRGAEVRLVLTAAELSEWQALFQAAETGATTAGAVEGDTRAAGEHDGGG